MSLQFVHFSLQLDEPRDVSYVPKLLVFIWMFSNNCNVMEEQLKTIPLNGKAGSEKVFQNF